jgi:hypothetical protein
VPREVQDCLFCAIIGQMCPTGHDMTSCTACIQGGGMNMCSGGIPNGTCDAGETMTTCPQDCP